MGLFDGVVGMMVGLYVYLTWLRPGLGLMIAFCCRIGSWLGGCRRCLRSG